MVRILKKIVAKFFGKGVIYEKTRAIYSMIRWGVWVLPKAEYGYCVAGLITNKNSDFMRDPAFVNAFKAGQGQLEGKDPDWDGWSRYLNLWAAFHAKQLDGDFVECGVFRGANARSIMTYIDFKNMKGRKFFLFDTFCGLDEKYASQEEIDGKQKAYIKDTYSFVVDSFKDFPNTEIVRGAVPETLNRVNIQKVAYLSIDMNCVMPEIEALRFFWPKMVSGGIVILDDYGWGGLHDVQKEAQDKFAESVGVKIFTHPFGQGMMIKP